jgi:tRNA dimethylallyltransferase
MQSERKSPFDFRYFVLTDAREKLYERIDRRVDKMLEAGLTDEVKGLMERGLDLSYVSMQGLGYKEIAAYLNGTIDLDEAVNRIKTGSRHFAKRQFTWFNNREDFHKIERDRYKEPGREIPEAMYEYLKERGGYR